MTTNTFSKATLSAARLETIKAVFAACIVGFGLLWVTGFSAVEAAHDAAHDTRHAQSFPCH